MTEEYWLVAAFGLAVALGIGFFLGRRTAPTQGEVQTAQKERDEACAEVDRVRGEVARHFEESANMFGRLADDYRTFFEQFAQTAQNLGLSEGRARELLQQADPKLVANQSAPSAAACTEPTSSVEEFDPDDCEPMGFEAGAPTDAGGEEALAEEQAGSADATDRAKTEGSPSGRSPE